MLRDRVARLERRRGILGQHRRGTLGAEAVACLVLPGTQEDPTIGRAVIYSGQADGAEEPLLAPLDAVIAANANDAVPRFGLFFPAVGSAQVAWTTRETPSGPEVLKLAHVDDPATKVTIASDVHDPFVSPDGKSWWWLRAVDPTGIGILQTASFPDGSGATDVLAGRITPGELSQFVLYSVFAAGALGELSQVWGEIAQASGAAERLGEILGVEPTVAPPARPAALPRPVSGRVALEDVVFAYPTAAERPVLHGLSAANHRDSGSMGGRQGTERSTSRANLAANSSGGRGWLQR